MKVEFQRKVVVGTAAAELGELVGSGGVTWVPEFAWMAELAWACLGGAVFVGRGLLWAGASEAC